MTQRERAADAARRATDRGKKGLVWFITHDKFIQALVTGTIIGAITSFGEGLSIYVQIGFQDLTGLFVPAKWFLGLILSVLFVAAFWIDNHTDEWREFVRDATGEETADDSDE